MVGIQARGGKTHVGRLARKVVQYGETYELYDPACQRTHRRSVSYLLACKAGTDVTCTKCQALIAAGRIKL